MSSIVSCFPLTYSLQLALVTIMLVCNLVCICNFRMDESFIDDLNDWNPMEESFYDDQFNSYDVGAGSRLPRHQQPANMKCVFSNFHNLFDESSKTDSLILLFRWLNEILFLHRRTECQQTKLFVFGLSERYTRVCISWK